jgi:ApaG protein
MVTRTTSGVNVSVEVGYADGQSDPNNMQFVFTYRVRIINRNAFAVKLLGRHWEIFDSAGERTVVDGPGVVGKQPEIAPGEEFVYESACHLHSTIGTMQGWYLMIEKATGRNFKVEIPEFSLETPFVLN